MRAAVTALMSRIAAIPTTHDDELGDALGVTGCSLDPSGSPIR